jgi:hypothetical protein
MNRQDMRTGIDYVRQRVEGKQKEHIVYISIPQYNNSDGSLSGIRVIGIGSKGALEDQCFENKLGVATIFYGTSC